MMATCDARYYFNQGGMPSIVYGGANANQSHAKNERANIPDVLETAVEYAKLVAGGDTGILSKIGREIKAASGESDGETNTETSVDTSLTTEGRINEYGDNVYKYTDSQGRKIYMNDEGYY